MPTMNTNCHVCDSDNTYKFFELPPMPTQDGNMAATRPEAINNVRGSIQLRFCENCGFIANEGYDADKISFTDYDFSNDHSPLFQAFVSDLINRLVETYDLQGKTILDVGCGDGAFLQLICEKSNSKGIGIDPGFDHSKRKLKEGLDIEYIHDFYSEKHDTLKADFIACRLVIDLLEDQTQFLKMLRHNLEEQPDTIVYIEVPNALHTFEDKIFWNVIYERSAWYTVDSYAYHFEKCGFEVLRVAPCWNDEFLGIEARPRPLHIAPSLPNTVKLQSLSKTVHEFNSIFKQEISQCKNRIEHIQQEGLKVIAWGAGARALTFFNLFDLIKSVPYIIDINTKRQGKFLPGSAQEIVAPEFIIDYQPDLCIITNPTYADEIKANILELGVNPKIWVL